MRGPDISILTSFPSRVTTGMRTFGRFTDLTFATFGFMIRDIIGMRFVWREAVDQAWFVVTVTVIPAILVSIPFGVIVSVQVGSLTSQIGATSIAGAAGGLGVIRQGAPIVTALLLGGAAGSAIAADLGARTVREEIDAMRVMGIDPVRRLASPRLFAMIIVAPLLCCLVIFMGLVTGYVVNVGFQGGTPGSYMSSFASMADLVVSLVKAEVFGIIVVLVACQRGFEATSGPRGVANAVNASVVVGVISAFIVNAMATQLVTVFLPQRLG
ncbi:MAG: ABC transporter permease [Rhodococcus sp. (in: high G+C Gram-positive bacteria)]